MSETLDKVGKFFGDTFGNGTTGIQWGAVGSVAVGAIGGFLLGDVVGAAIGLAAGTLLGPVINNLITNNFGGGAHKDRPPVGIDPRAQEKARETLDLSIDGKVFKIDLPKITELKRPWGSEGSDTFIHKMGEDTLSIVKNPENKSQSTDLLLKTVKERNQPFYDYMATVQRYHTDYEKYNTTTRPAIMTQLGIDPKGGAMSGVFSPPTYDKKLALEITNEKEMGLDARTHLGLSEDTWNKFDAITKLSRIEESMNKRMFEVSQKNAKLKLEMEAQDRKVPFDFDFSGNSFADRLKWVTGSLFADSSDTRIEKAFKNFYEGKPEHRTHGVIIRDEKAAEDEFRNAMESLATDYVAKGHKGGDVAAAQFREMISLLIEERKVRIQWNGIKLTKQMWAGQAERWTKEADEFRTELTGYAATYANGAGANKNYAIIKEFAIPMMGNIEAETREKQLRAERAAGMEKLRKANEDVKLLLIPLDASLLTVLQPIDVAKDIKTMPTEAEVTGRNVSHVPTDPHERKYHDAAKRLEAALGIRVKVSGGESVKVAGSKYEEYIPNFVIDARTTNEGKKLQEKLVAARNAAGITKETMPIGMQYGSVTINASALMDLKMVSEKTKPVDGGDIVLDIEKARPAGVKEDLFKKLEANKGALQNATKEFTNDPYLRDILETAAINYNTKLEAFKKNKDNNRAIAELKVAHEHMLEAILKYMKDAVHMNEVYDKLRAEELTELGKQSSKGTSLEGTTGFRVFVVDKRGGKNQKIALDGIKKGDKYTVTGWSRMTEDEHMGEQHFFGKDMSDTAAGMAFDPKTMSGLDEIMKKTDGEPKAKTTPEIVTPAVTEKVTPPVEVKPAATVAATSNILEQALSSVSFKPLANAADTYVVPLIKDLFRSAIPVAVK